METGDLVLRHDVQILADEGRLEAPVTTWPLSWGDIARGVNRIDENTLSPAARAAYLRLKRRAREAARVKRLDRHVRVAAGNPGSIRSFEAIPREKGEIEAGLEWMGERFAFRLQAATAFDAKDDQTFRLDGSYAGFILGNWMFSAALRDRWWGPGWDGGLILSSNARPVPMLVLERNYSDPFEFPVLKWLGPWKLTTFMGQLEGSRAVPDAWLFGLRVNFRPFNGDLELGASRTAQWCGSGRDCGFSTFADLLTGVDNTGTPDEPGNQLAGGDMRWASPFTDHPYALYGEVIGEDEAGGLPSKRIGLFGIETWGAFRDATFRIHLEYADTAVRGFYTNPDFNVAYNHSIYQTGYRYRGRPIGHTLDNDGEMISLGAKLIDQNGRYWNLTFRSIQLNRDGAGQNALTITDRDILNVELTNKRDLRGLQLHWGIGLDHVETDATGESDLDTRIFVQLTAPL